MYSPTKDKPEGRVLLIDDDHVLVDLVKDGLEYGGYEVVTAHNGGMGLEMPGGLPAPVGFSTGPLPHPTATEGDMASPA